MSIAVAIDGPVGAGKSSIAKECAKRLGFIYVDTGALYRCIGLFCDRNGVNIDDASRVEAALSHITLDVNIKNGTQYVYLNGYDVSEEIRLPEISMAASKVSAIPAVREYLLQFQRYGGKSECYNGRQRYWHSSASECRSENLSHSRR